MSDDEGGYCKPPKKHQFKKGVSGCPDGGWEQRRKNQKARAKKEKVKKVRLSARIAASVDKLREVLTDGERVEMTSGEFIFKKLEQAAQNDSTARRLYFSILKDLGLMKPEPEKGRGGVVVVRAPATTTDEWLARAKAMPPLPLNPLEGLPGIDITKLPLTKRRTTPDVDDDE